MAAPLAALSTPPEVRLIPPPEVMLSTVRFAPLACTETCWGAERGAPVKSTVPPLCVSVRDR